MASEILLSVNAQASYNGAGWTAISTSLALDATGGTFQTLTATGTATGTAAAISWGDISTPDLLIIKNTDAANNLLVSMESDGSTPFATVPPGGCQPIWYPGASMYLKSNSTSTTWALSIVEK